MPSLPRRSAAPARARKNAHQRGYTRVWEKARAAFIADQFAQGNVFCGECKKPLINNNDIEVDHIIPHKGDRSLFWDQSNWQCVHKACHTRKTARGE